MGIRKIEDEMDLREAMKKKATELKIKEIEAKASAENLTKDKIDDLAKKHGVILALNPKLKGEVNLLQEKYNIPSSKIITEQIYESDVLVKSKKIDNEKLGMLAYQRVLMRKEETGGILQLSEVFELINTGILKGVVELKDLVKAMKILKNNRVIDDVKQLDSEVFVIHFFSVQYTGDEVKVLELAKEKDFLTLENVCITFNWSQDRALKVLLSLQNSGVAKFKETLLTGKQWFFPSL
ncbi:MAG TPA: hypothetical protein VGB37_16910 [Candidatus Lokiarchaeia archaeon]